MIGEGWPVISELLGLGADKLLLWQMALRAVLVYLAAIVLVRLGEKRFLGNFAALDIILGFMLGSVLAGAITGSTGFFETILGAALILVFMHWLFAQLAYSSERIADVIKGDPRVLVREGQFQRDAMRASHITEEDLMAVVRVKGQLDDVQKIAEARLERNGEISVIERAAAPRVIEIAVQDSVQTVRLEMG